MIEKFKKEERGEIMEKIYLCGAGGCPAVILHDDGTVEIGEGNNTCKLTASEWNELVRLIKEGKIKSKK